jgi:hypothetical protein
MSNYLMPTPDSHTPCSLYCDIVMEATTSVACGGCNCANLVGTVCANI